LHHIVAHQPEDLVDFHAGRGNALHHRYRKRRIAAFVERGLAVFGGKHHP
jgi:hypothetical protein